MMLYDNTAYEHRQDENLNPLLYAEYQNTRWIPPEYRHILCYAPFTSLNFDQTGEITACCYNRNLVLGRFPEQSILAAWSGKNMQYMRDSIQHKDFGCGCHFCHDALKSRNFSGALLNYYDMFYKDINHNGMPSVFVFEISNLCNLECIMCGGKWSSAIRRNRENLPEIKHPYNDAFVEQVKGFIPYLRTMNFLGGEPFLVPLYYAIWDAVIELNPNIEVCITTNGTILNERIKNLLRKLPTCKITVSVDSLQQTTYEYIRKNASYTTLIENIEYFLQEKKLVSFSVCPMIPNWQDIPAIVSFCEKNNIDIFFNIVFQALGGNIRGIHENGEQDFIWNSATENYTTYHRLSSAIPEFCLHKAPASLLREIITYYEGFRFSANYQKQFQSLINQIKTWIKEK